MYTSKTILHSLGRSFSVSLFQACRYVCPDKRTNSIKSKKVQRCSCPPPVPRSVSFGCIATSPCDPPQPPRLPLGNLGYPGQGRGAPCPTRIITDPRLISRGFQLNKQALLVKKLLLGSRSNSPHRARRQQRVNNFF